MPVAWSVVTLCGQFGFASSSLLCFGLGRVSTGLCVSVCFGGRGCLGAGGVGGTLFNPVRIVFYRGEGGIWITFTEKIQRQPSRASQPN